MPERLPGKRVLIVEDNPALAFDINDIFSDHGAEVVGPAMDLPTGMQLVRDNNLDAAVLDIDLGGEFVWPLARELKGHKVPFVFVSAECTDRLPEDFFEATCLDKPAPSDMILTTVANLIHPPVRQG